MDSDSSESPFTITEMRKDDPRLKEYDEIAEEEKQSSIHFAFQVLPGSDRLELEEMDLVSWREMKLTMADFNSLVALGLRGKIRISGCGSSGEEPFTSRTLIVAQDSIKEPVDLPQPNNCEVIYYQIGDEWLKFPAEAPVLKKRFRLTPDPAKQQLYHMWAEAYFGSEAGSGGGAFNWKRAV
jgi:hypothetical protein